jgi:hypothetical protein
MALFFCVSAFNQDFERMATKQKAKTPTKRALAPVKTRKAASKKLLPEKKKTEVKKDIAKTYNEYKKFEGKQYTGMKIGRAHKWYYDKGEWKEKKVTPDDWEFTYAVTKRRAGKAPEGSGAPVGTEYHWYILAHQNVRKLNANDYTTSMTGLKVKIAHKRADHDKWNISDRAQRKRLIKVLQDMIDKLQQEDAQQTD